MFAFDLGPAQTVADELALTVPYFGISIAYYVVARFLLHHFWLPSAPPAKQVRARAWLITLALSTHLSAAGVYYTFYCLRTWASQWPLGNFSMEFNIDHTSTWFYAFDSRYCCQVRKQ
jgi:hypothetical protein